MTDSPQQQALALVLPLLKDQETFKLTIGVREAWTVVNALFGARKYEHLSRQQADLYMAAAGPLQRALVGRYPAIQDVMRRFDERVAQAIRLQADSDEVPLHVEMEVRQAYYTVSGMQVVQFSNLPDDVKATCEQIGRLFQGLIVARYPEVEPVLERGWAVTLRGRT